MASPKNYERRKDQEGGRIPFMWQNQINYNNVMVIRNLAGTYDVEYSERELETDFTNKQDARKWAVKWMENNPYGRTSPFTQFKKGNRTPGDTTKYRGLVLVSLGTRGRNWEGGAPSGDAAVYKNGKKVDVISFSRMASENRLEEYLNQNYV